MTTTTIKKTMDKSERAEWVLRSVEHMNTTDARRFLEAELQLAFLKGRTSVFEKREAIATLEYDGVIDFQGRMKC